MKKIYLLVPVLIIFVVLVWPRSYSDEEKITNALNQLITGLADRDLSAVMNTLCDSYADSDGLTKKSIRGILFQRHQRNQGIVLRLADRTLDVSHTTAVIKTQITLLDGTLFSTSPDPLVFDVEIQLKNENTQWCISGHDKTLVE